MASGHYGGRNYPQHSETPAWTEQLSPANDLTPTGLAEYASDQAVGSAATPSTSWSRTPTGTC